MKKILLLNGPNLNLLGVREKNIYGSETLASIEEDFKSRAAALGYEAECFQSNSEGALIDKIHESRLTCAGIVLNAGAYTHYSYALRDAISAVSLPVAEVHMSDIKSREEFRHTSVIEPVCIIQISGFGRESYFMGLKAVDDYIKEHTYG